MIDIHSHILPKVDDGSRSLEMSIQIAKEAKQAGITDIICTSHYLLGHYEKKAEELEKRRQELQLELNKIELGLQLHLGNEIFLEENMVQFLQEKKASSLAGSPYVLMEFPMNFKAHSIEDQILNLRAGGFIPIIAHPERYSYIQDDPNLLLDYLQKGALCQVNYASVLGRYGLEAKKTVKILLKHHMAQFIASDTHREHSIFLQMDEIIEKLCKWIGEEETQKLITRNPKKILEKEEIDEIEPSYYKRNWLS